MILATGLTPAWQQILTFANFRIGQVNRAETSAACASGKVLNVGCAVHHLGGAVHTLSPVGGATGAQIREDFEHLEIPATWLETRAATRVCTTLLDSDSGVTTELVENSAPLSADELEQFADAYRDRAIEAELVVMSGSLPQRTPSDYYAELIDVTPGRVLLDARGPELRACLAKRPWLVKPNREELAMTIGRPLATDDDIVAAIRELQSAGAQHVVVSDGAAGLWAADAHHIERYPIFAVSALNPIGCGDCLAAGLAVAAVERRSWRDVVEFGIAAAAENASRLLPGRFSRAAVESHLVRRA